MINNRQNGAGRRRGRGGQRPPGMSGNSGGNARDQRQRGNAAQLLEKYKSLARDSQLAGDRVQTEYWLQFADHYFRVLGESRARFDEQRRARGENVDDDGYDDDGEGFDDEGGDDDQPQQQQQPQQQREQPRRQQEGDRYERQDRPQQERPQQDRQQQDRQPPRGDRYERNDRPERQDRQRAERPQRADNDRPVERVERVERLAERPVERSERSERSPRADNDRPSSADRPERAERAAPRARRVRAEPQDEPRIDFAVIPPAIGVIAEAPAADATEEAAPVRRVRRPRPKGDADIAPAA